MSGLDNIRERGLVGIPGAFAEEFFEAGGRAADLGEYLPEGSKWGVMLSVDERDRLLAVAEAAKALADEQAKEWDGAGGDAWRNLRAALVALEEK
jgi:hypothetical protein